jgi:hypothetical protein
MDDRNSVKYRDVPDNCLSWEDGIGVRQRREKP